MGTRLGKEMTVKSARLTALSVLCIMALTSLVGCRYQSWQNIQVGRSTASEISAILETPVGPEDRYVYALSKDKLSGNTVLIMANLDYNGIVSAKYYWRSVPRPIVPFRMDSWEMALETQIEPSELQKYSPALGQREESVLQYLGGRLLDTSRRFAHSSEVVGITGSMNQIVRMASNAYSMRADKETLLSEDGFAFDGGIHGNKFSMTLGVIDERQGIYRLVLKGYRTGGFFSGR